MAEGRLQIKTYSGDTYVPVKNAKVSILDKTNQGNALYNINTDTLGASEEINLTAPPIEYSMRPSKEIPYSLYDVRVQADGYEDLFIKGCQIYPEQLAIQQCNMRAAGSRQWRQELIDILPNTLVGNYPSKIPELAIKPIPKGESGFVVLNEVVIPEYITVHAGDPNNNSAPNYTVRYKDYIKNVASCEIFSTWPENTIRSNVYCIISFTLNRIYTEWYRNKGKNFQITNSTAYDHAFIYGRNIYSNIGRIVDEIFSTYVKIPTAKQPLLTQYCDGVKVQCPGWLTQWGSKYLGEQGRTPYEILTHFYGNNISFASAPKVAGIPQSYPGYTLGIGATGTPVRNVQTFLNKIAVNYPIIPKVAVNGTYDQATRNAVLAFQKLFNLSQTGSVNYTTWYKISDIYVGVTKIAELK